MKRNFLMIYFVKLACVVMSPTVDLPIPKLSPSAFIVGLGTLLNSRKYFKFIIKR